MKILFTGHRDCYAGDEELDIIRTTYGIKDTWIHGGARGCDTSVQEYAERWGIKTLAVRPEYDKFPPKYAPLERDKMMVGMADLVVAFYDGRLTGGTYYTMNYAKQLGKEILVFTPLCIKAK